MKEGMASTGIAGIEIDNIIHQPIRMKIVTLLAGTNECDYTTIKKSFSLTDGHMTTHMRELLKSRYVEQRKEFINDKPKTTYKLSMLGRKKYIEYVKTLKRIISM